MLGQVAKEYIDKKSDLLKDLSKQIWDNPEIAYKERFASKLLAYSLEEEGFKIEMGYANVPTAFRATWGSGSPVIGFLGEYDALPGMSQKVSDKKEPIIEGAAGHACAHNLIGVAHLGAAIAMKREM